MGLFIVPLVLIQLPWILPEMIFEHFIGTAEYILSGNFLKDLISSKNGWEEQ